MYDWKSFHPLCSCLFTFLMVSFEAQKFYIWIMQFFYFDVPVVVAVSFYFLNNFTWKKIYKLADLGK